MAERPMSSSELARALDCRLVQPDGSRWEVVEVTLQRDRAWVRARSMENGSRLYDIALPPSGRLEWRFPGGWMIRARRTEEGGLRWSVDGPGGETQVDGPGDFFRDAFLGCAADHRRRRRG